MDLDWQEAIQMFKGGKTLAADEIAATVRLCARGVLDGEYNKQMEIYAAAMTSQTNFFAFQKKRLVGSFQLIG